MIHPIASLNSAYGSILFVLDTGMGSPYLTSIEEGWQYTVLTDLYFSMYCEMLVVPSLHLQLSKYIGCFSDMNSYLSDKIGWFIYCWAQVAEFVNYFQSITID